MRLLLDSGISGGTWPWLLHLADMVFLGREARAVAGFGPLADRIIAGEAAINPDGPPATCSRGPQDAMPHRPTAHPLPRYAQNRREEGVMARAVHAAIGQHPILCLMCDCGTFHKREVLLNTTGMELFNMAWANRSATGLICASCGYAHLFVNPSLRTWPPKRRP